MVAGSSSYEVIYFFFKFTYSLQPHHGHGIYSAVNRNAYQKIFGSKARPAHRADNLTAICEPFV
jgi:hypothetical protein